MATCPAGHVSSTDDWCDVCGAPIAAAAVATPVDSGTEMVASARASATLASCPVCGALRPAADRFCEHCGSDLSAADPGSASWIAEVAADQALYERIGPMDVTFPAGRSPRVVTISAPEVLIGRSSESRGIRAAIDLSGPLADPGVSHRHAVLARLEDGSYAITDLGSTNGTTLNDGRVTVEPERAYPLADGDRIHVGAWTTITVRRRTG